MVPDGIKDRWEGPAWRWWALGCGVVLTTSTAAAAMLVAALSGGDARSLTLLGLLIELLAIGISGSGMLDGLSGRAIAGGMARQPLPERRLRSTSRPATDQARRDRHTIRAGILAVPLLVVFLVLLFW
jgi:hypothetical protein